jgi:hypothetical protein
MCCAGLTPTRSSSAVAGAPYTRSRRLGEYFAADIQNRVIGVKPEFESAMGKGKDISPRYDRHRECEMWLRNKQVWLPQNLRANVPWIALDDRSYLFRPGCKNLLQVQGKWGFCPADALRLEAMLRERCHDQQ